MEAVNKQGIYQSYHSDLPEWKPFGMGVLCVTNVHKEEPAKKA